MTIDDIALTLEKGINLRTIVHLVECFGSAQAVYEASTEQLMDVAELRQPLAEQLRAKSNHGQADKEIKHIEKYGVTAIESTSDSYPQLLKECCDYPHVIYVRGNIDALNETMLTMVGTRNITGYGAQVSDDLIKSLARINPELVVVSGLAFGIDAACHRAALQYGLRTVGVVPSCLPDITPRHHQNLAEDIIRHGGCVVSEFNTCSAMYPKMFLRRNRIVAGLSLGTVVIEAMERSGSLNTANLADGYSRVVMAVPGRVGDKTSCGTNDLIRRLKARMVCNGVDIAAELGWEVDQTQSVGLDTSLLDKDQLGLYNCLKGDMAFSVDTVVNMTGLSVNAVSSLIFDLESGGFIRSLPGCRYEKIS